MPKLTLTWFKRTFCLPMSNGHLEKVFLTLKLIKCDRKSSLGEDQLDNLLRIAIDSPALSYWDPDGAVQLWWKTKQRRTVQDTRPPSYPEKILAQVVQLLMSLIIWT